MDLSDFISLKLGVEEEDNGEHLDLNFPKLLWVVRDFFLETSLTDKEYLEKALADVRGMRKSIFKANDIRRAIVYYSLHCCCILITPQRAFFKDRDCVRLPQPMGEDGDLQNLVSIPYNNLRPQFREKMDTLSKSIVEHAPKKQFYFPEANTVKSISCHGNTVSFTC